jgi:hypothetical protein
MRRRRSCPLMWGRCRSARPVAGEDALAKDSSLALFRLAGLSSARRPEPLLFDGAFVVAGGEGSAAGRGTGGLAIELGAAAKESLAD